MISQQLLFKMLLIIQVTRIESVGSINSIDNIINEIIDVKNNVHQMRESFSTSLTSIQSRSKAIFLEALQNLK